MVPMGVILSGDLYCCHSMNCEALHACLSNSTIATQPERNIPVLVEVYSLENKIAIVGS